MNRATLELFAPLDRAAPTPLRAQLEDAICAAITRGGAPAGTRLPASRVLAEALGVSRGVVSEAYAQIAAEGWIEVRHGAAPIVRDVPAAGIAPSAAAPPARAGAPPAAAGSTAAAQPAGVAALAAAPADVPLAAAAPADVPLAAAARPTSRSPPPLPDSRSPPPLRLASRSPPPPLRRRPARRRRGSGRRPARRRRGSARAAA